MLYQGLLIIHIVSFVAWMAGLLYLPRLFVYHSLQPIGGECSELFKTMESRLYTIILTPAMLATWLTGLSLAIIGLHYHSLWFGLKLFAVLVLSGLHGFFGACRRQLANDHRKFSSRFYKWINEVPAVILVIVVSLVIWQP